MACHHVDADLESDPRIALAWATQGQWNWIDLAGIRKDPFG